MNASSRRGAASRRLLRLTRPLRWHLPPVAPRMSWPRGHEESRNAADSLSSRARDVRGGMADRARKNRFSTTASSFMALLVAVRERLKGRMRAGHKSECEARPTVRPITYMLAKLLHSSHTHFYNAD